MPVVTQTKYPEVYRALCELLGKRKKFDVIDHFATWLPKMNGALGLLRKRNPENWKTFVASTDYSEVLRVRDTQTNLRGAHLFLDFMAN